MSKVLIAIDPGKNGAIAFCIGDDLVDAVRMSETMTNIHAQLSEIATRGTVQRVLLEKTGTYRPGNSGPAAVNFARHCGQVEAFVYALGLPSDQIAPGKWMKSFLGVVPSDKKQRKLALKEKAQRLYPHLDVTFATADALGILTVLRDDMEK